MDSTVEYEGDFQAGLPHGEGVCIFANGARYEGNKVSLGGLPGPPPP